MRGGVKLCGCREMKKTGGVIEIAVNLTLTYLRLGILSAMPVIPAMMLPWEIMTPLGMPVEPLVYMMTAMSEACGCLRFTATAETEEQRADGLTRNGSHTNINKNINSCDNKRNRCLLSKMQH